MTAVVSSGDLRPGLTAVIRRTVRHDDTARALGSGDLDVLGTPRLLAWCEQATLAALDEHLPEGRTTVGSRVELVHERASALDTSLELHAVLEHVDGRLLRFEVVGEQVTAAGPTTTVGRARITRVVVDRERFLGRL